MVTTASIQPTRTRWTRAMHVVETGILCREKPLVSIGLFGKGLSDSAKDMIFHGIFTMISEIFKDQVLKILDLGGYTVFFWGFHPFKPVPGAHLLDSLILVYAIVDMEDDKIDDPVKTMISTKMRAVAGEFEMLYSMQEPDVVFSGFDYTTFKNVMSSVFKDLAQSPGERFDAFFGN